MVFKTRVNGGNQTERMRIDSSAVIIGTHNSNAHRLAIESRHATVPFGQIVAGSSDQNQAVGFQFVTRNSNGDEKYISGWIFSKTRCLGGDGFRKYLNKF